MLECLVRLHRPFPAPRPLLAFLYLLALAALSIYLCREVFLREHTGYMNSMHGFWMAISRLAGAHWLVPAWWPYWDGGMPFEHTYAPLVPAATRCIAGLSGASISRAFHALAGFIYCLGPLTMFIMAWRLSAAPGYGFAAAVAYSLTAPAQLLAPEDRFRWGSVGDAWRLYLNFVWDEAPHLLALALASIAMIFLARLLADGRRRRDWLLGVVFAAGAVLANPFGFTILAMAAVSLWLASGARRHGLVRMLAVGVVVYLLVSPFYPPSLVAAIGTNSRLHDAWPATSIAAAGVAALGTMLLWLALRRWTRDGFVRFLALFAWLVSGPPLLETWLGWHYLPQANRYKIEMEWALALLAAFAARGLIGRFRWRWRVLVCLPLVWLAGRQIAVQRGFAKTVLRSVDIRQTVEYRAALWIERHLPGQRVMAPGSMAQWMNAFSGVGQLSGGPFSTTPNLVQQLAVDAIYRNRLAGDRDAALSLLWLKAFGVEAVATTGPASQEFWKPFTNPEKFHGRLPVLWQEPGTTLYRVPQRSSSLAHVIPATASVTRRPRDGLDTAELERYVAALDDASRPVARLRWTGSNRAVIETQLARGEVVSIQVNYHPGWHARVNGTEAAIHRDGLGLMRIEPACQGACPIELIYDGGWEFRLCRWLPAAALLALAAGRIVVWHIDKLQ